MVKSTPVFQRIFIRGRQVADITTVASMSISSVVAVKLVLFGNSPRLCGGVRRKRKEALSFGRHGIGNFRGLKFKAIADPSDRFISMAVMITS